jgi:hypothetical protein
MFEIYFINKMGIGDWANPQSPIPNPPSPIPNPQSPFINVLINKIIIQIKLILDLKFKCLFNKIC